MKLPRFHYHNDFNEFEDFITTFDHRVLHYKKGDVVFKDLHYDMDDKIYYYVRKGLISVFGITENANKRLICSFGAGCFCTIDLQPQIYNIFTIINNTALSDTTILLFRHEAMTEILLRNKRLCLRMIDFNTEMIAMLTYQLISQACFSADIRLCEFLLITMRHSGYGKKAEPKIIRITQQEIADSIGVTRTQVSRVLQRLKQGGIVATNRNRITILDQNALNQRCSSSFFA